MSSSRRPEKHLFLTTGATAPFTTLIQASLTSDLLSALRDHEFTHLTVQAGAALTQFNEALGLLDEHDGQGLQIRGFDFNKQGLGAEMRLCQAKDQDATQAKRLPGVVVSHAGTGSILDAMRLNIRLVVVPNPKLLDNHQEDFAKELERQGYVTKSDIEGLPDAIARALLHKPTDTTQLRPASIAPIVDDLVGYEEDVRSRLD